MTKEVGSRRRLWLWGPLLSLGILAAFDQIVVRMVLGSESLNRWTLVPFGTSLTADQETWLASISAPLEERRNTIFLVEGELGWTNAPHGTNADGNESTNSRGFRGQREYATPKPEGVVRIVSVGDSYTWGADVPDDSSFSAAIERLRPGLEAANLGVSAYGTDQALMRYRRDGLELEADYAILGVMVENIGRIVNRYRPLWVPSSTVSCVKPRFILEGDEFTLVPSPFQSVEELVAAVRDGSVIERAREHEYWHTRPHLQPLAISPTARLVGGMLATRQREVRGLWEDTAGEPYRLMRAIIETFHADARAAGAKQALALFLPTRNATHAAFEGEARYWQGMMDELEAQGIPVLDVTDALLEEQARQKASGTRSPMYTKRNHLRPLYNEAVARAILEKLGL